MSNGFFEGVDQIPTQDAPADPAPAASKESLQFIGEGKKYKSIEDADVGLVNANTHIEKLESENAALRQKAVQADTYASVIEKLGLKEQGNTTPAVTAPETSDTHANFTPSQLEAMATKIYESRDAKKQSEQNRLHVLTELKKEYGNRVKEIFVETQESLGVDLEELARKSPQAALKLLIPTREKAPVSSFTPSAGRVSAPVSRGGSELAGYEGKGILDLTQDKNFLSIKDPKERNAYVEQKLRENRML